MKETKQVRARYLKPGMIILNIPDGPYRVVSVEKEEKFNPGYILVHLELADSKNVITRCSVAHSCTYRVRSA